MTPLRLITHSAGIITNDNDVVEKKIIIKSTHGKYRFERVRSKKQQQTHLIISDVHSGYAGNLEHSGHVIYQSGNTRLELIDRVVVRRGQHVTVRHECVQSILISL